MTPPQTPTDPPARKPWSTTDKVLLASIGLMTALILVGLIAVVMRLLSGPDVAAPGIAATTYGPLGIEGEVGAMALDGDRLAVHMRGPAGGAIVIYDLARGTEEARIPLGSAGR